MEKVKQSHYRPWEFQEVEAPRFQDNQHMKMIRLSALHTSHLYPQAIFLVLISFRGWVNPRAISAAGRIIPMKNCNDNIGNLTRDFQTCSAVPQPTAPLCTPIYLEREMKITTISTQIVPPPEKKKLVFPGEIYESSTWIWRTAHNHTVMFV